MTDVPSPRVPTHDELVHRHEVELVQFMEIHGHPEEWSRAQAIAFGALMTRQRKELLEVIG